jgi:hypothetical protein
VEEQSVNIVKQRRRDHGWVNQGCKTQ